MGSDRTLLGALAGGAGGELGRQAWAGLTALVSRPSGGGQDSSGRTPSAGSGEPELLRLQQAPADVARAQALSTALAVRAALDAEFSAALRQWRAQAEQVPVHQNTISGGIQYGPVVQGHTFSHLTFNSSAPAAPDPDTDGRPRPARD
ncbi:hypothetical protein [Streptomyces cyanogenus]|uniref:hypothetical protein n=1 Tax=Streptomyces cyanogenus TaxID=80860 RepID=UPI001AA1724F|nr:hypothetical protein [Streptomyces cyanogenus]